MGRRWDEREATDDSRLDRLRRLVAHAYERVPFYRERFQLAGVRPADIRSIDDLALLPITEKRDLADRPAGEITAAGLDPARLVSTMTSGYSGEPFVIRRTRGEQTRWARSWLPDLLAAGLRNGDRVASVFAVREERPDGVGLLESLGLVTETVVDCAEEPSEIVRRLAEARPDFLRGMAGVLEHLAGELAVAERPVRPRVVWVSGEVLTPVARRRIEAAFAAPVHNAYGTHEIGLLASDCRDSGLMHVSSPESIVEILTPDNRPAEEGETGEVVVTALDFFAAPFIRYRLKDLATRGAAACPCGVRSPTIAHIDGRSIDYFEMPDGRYLHPYRILGPALAAAPWVRQYQLVQETRHRIVLRLVREGPLDEAERRRLRSTVDSLLGPDVRFWVEAVPRIAASPGGKPRPIVSLVE
jgi:phenylacetate-CoA ligase